MSDMRSTIIPKSDQLNYDDLVNTSKTIKITKVVVKPSGEQPVSVFYEGDNGKPYKPCKGMCRAMVIVWGDKSINYVGRSMTLFGNPSVVYAGFACGGIQISHMSHMDAPKTFALTEKKGSRKPYTIKPLIINDELETTITSDQQKEIVALITERKIAPSDFMTEFKIKKSSELPADKMDEATKWINDQKGAE